MEQLAAILVGSGFGIIGCLAFCHAKQRVLSLMLFSPITILVVSMGLEKLAFILNSRQFQSIASHRALILVSYSIGFLLLMLWSRMVFIRNLNLRLKRIQVVERLTIIDLLRFGYSVCEEKFETMCCGLKVEVRSVEYLEYAISARMRDLCKSHILENFTQRDLPMPLVPNLGNLIGEEDLDSYLRYILTSFIKLFFEEGTARFVIRQFDTNNQKMVVRLSSDLLNPPGNILLLEPNMITEAMRVGKPIAYSRNKWAHSKTKLALC